MEVLQRNKTVVKGLLSHIICSMLEVRFSPDARQRSSKASIGELSLCCGGLLMISSPLPSFGKRRIGTISSALLGSRTISATYVLIENGLGYAIRQVRHSPFQHVKQCR